MLSLLRSAENDKTTTMNATQTQERFWRSRWIIILVCWLIAVPLALVGLVRGLIQVLAMGGLKYDCWEHYAIFFVGWLFVLACFTSAYILVARPSYQRLWVLVPCILLYPLDSWLGSLPAAQHLIH